MMNEKANLKSNDNSETWKNENMNDKHESMNEKANVKLKERIKLETSKYERESECKIDWKNRKKWKNERDIECKIKWKIRKWTTNPM